MILNDDQIRQRIATGMIDGAAMEQVRKGSISYGVSSFGYDMRVANEWQLWRGDKVSTIDPKRRDLHTKLDVKVSPTVTIPRPLRSHRQRDTARTWVGRPRHHRAEQHRPTAHQGVRR